MASYGSVADVVVLKESAYEEKLDKSLIGRQVAVKIARLGWCVGKIQKFYANRKDGINYEIRFVTRAAGLRNAYLAADAYGDDDDRMGNWVFVRPPLAVTNQGSAVDPPMTVARVSRKRPQRSQSVHDLSGNVQSFFFFFFSMMMEGASGARH